MRGDTETLRLLATSGYQVQVSSSNDENGSVVKKLELLLERE